MGVGLKRALLVGTVAVKDKMTLLKRSLLRHVYVM